MGSTYSRERVPTLDEVQRALSRRDYREALLRSDRAGISEQNRINLEYWRQRASILIGLGRLIEADNAVEHAQTLSAWRPEMFVSYLIEVATAVNKTVMVRARLVESLMDQLDEVAAMTKYTYSQRAHASSLSAVLSTKLVNRQRSRQVRKIRFRARALKAFAYADQLWACTAIDGVELEMCHMNRLQWFMFFLQSSTLQEHDELAELLTDILRKDTNRSRQDQAVRASPKWLQRRVNRS